MKREQSFDVKQEKERSESFNVCSPYVSNCWWSCLFSEVKERGKKLPFYLYAANFQCHSSSNEVNKAVNEQIMVHYNTDTLNSMLLFVWTMLWLFRLCHQLLTVTDKLQNMNKTGNKIIISWQEGSSPFHPEHSEVSRARRG